jgi:hypothetical protein
MTLDLTTLKDDLGIVGNEQDAWLTRRVDGVMARFEKYTSRRLAVPPATFVDDWGLLADQLRVWNEPPVLNREPRGSRFLRCFPVASIEAIKINDQDHDAAAVKFSPKTGELFTLTANQLAHDCGVELWNGRARITYKAGWATLPADLYEALLGIIQPLWAARQAQTAGIGAGAISSINVVDVGSVEVGDGLNPLVTASTRSPGNAVDPLLGPWITLLDQYVDLRVKIGSTIMPVTTEEAAALAASAAEPAPAPEPAP